MESGITTAPLAPPRADVLAETAYTHSEEDFVAWWLYHWEQAQNQRLHPLAHRLVDWTGLTMTRGLAIAFVYVTAAGLAGEKCRNYVIGGTGCIFCLAVGIGLVKWLLRGPSGLFRQLARRRRRRRFRRLAGKLAAETIYINLDRSHRLLLTPSECIHLSEVHEVEPGRTVSERREIITAWKAFEGIEATAQHAFFIDKGGDAVILPRRAFADEAAFQQFVNLARRLHRDAMAGYAPSVANWRR